MSFLVEAGRDFLAILEGTINRATGAEDRLNRAIE
jgi:hypothetical protein